MRLRRGKKLILPVPAGYRKIMTGEMMIPGDEWFNLGIIAENYLIGMTYNGDSLRNYYPIRKIEV